MQLYLTGGGTGGHVYPALVVYRAVREHAPGNDPCEALYVGGQGSIEQRLARQEGLAFEAISVGGLRGLAVVTQAQNLLRLGRAFLTIRGLFRVRRPDVVFATGGYVSAATIMAARSAGVPILIYLPDLEPGLAIKRLAPLATQIAVSFPEVVRFFRPEKTRVTGYPVRSEFFGVDREQARSHFQVAIDIPVVTVFGGSRGASSINLAVAHNLQGLLARTQVIHVTGPEDYADAAATREGLDEDRRARYVVRPYLDLDMHLALGAADLIVARAGAATLAEFPALGAASILVPYPYAGQHQDKNAEFLVSRGAAAKLEDDKLKADLGATVTRLLADPARLFEMRANSKRLARPEAAENIAKLVWKLAGR